MDKTNPGTVSEIATCIATPDTGLQSITGTCFLGMAGLGGSLAGNVAAWGTGAGTAGFSIPVSS